MFVFSIPHSQFYIPMIPFHDNESIEELGVAAFLVVAPAGDFASGAMLFLNARGEPLEFVFNRLELMSGALWRQQDKHHAAARRLCATLFQAAQLAPSVLFYRATDVEPGLFGPAGQLRLEIPVARLGALHQLLTPAIDEIATRTATFDSEGEAGDVDALWIPPPVGPAAELFAKLAARGLLLEPFVRADLALKIALEELEN